MTIRMRAVMIVLAVFLGLAAVGGATGTALAAVGGHPDGGHHARMDPHPDR